MFEAMLEEHLTIRGQTTHMRPPRSVSRKISLMGNSTRSTMSTVGPLSISPPQLAVTTINWFTPDGNRLPLDGLFGSCNSKSKSPPVFGSVWMGPRTLVPLLAQQRVYQMTSSSLSALLTCTDPLRMPCAVSLSRKPIARALCPGLTCNTFSSSQSPTPMPPTRLRASAASSDRHRPRRGLVEAAPTSRATREAAAAPFPRTRTSNSNR
mmetsp:Transcript_27954/g.76850  ORF Transcript_27954/g.76850 Transcript_27954/m.76850 type:complete len:209 (-) Transcript_27954:76-702(-)